MRSFHRFESDIPVKLIGKDGVTESGEQQLYNVSYGGLSCHSEKEYQPGDPIMVRIRQVDPPFEVTGIVVWCTPTRRGYDLGIQFKAGREAFVARMVAQVCQIEKYRLDVREKEGRELTSDQAAMEWIEQNAHKQEMQERAFIRHPVEIPIELFPADITSKQFTKLRNFSMEGASFESHVEIQIGEQVQIQVDQIDDKPEKRLEGEVIWCVKNGDKYQVGIQLKEDEEAFNAKMLKLLSRLECFREEVKRCEGRDLTGTEVVAEFLRYIAEEEQEESRGNT